MFLVVISSGWGLSLLLEEVVDINRSKNGQCTYTRPDLKTNAIPQKMLVTFLTHYSSNRNFDVCYQGNSTDTDKNLSKELNYFRILHDKNNTVLLYCHIVLSQLRAVNSRYSNHVQLLWTSIPMAQIYFITSHPLHPHTSHPPPPINTWCRVSHLWKEIILKCTVGSVGILTSHTKIYILLLSCYISD